MEDNRGELFVSLNQNDLLRETEIYFIEQLMGLILLMTQELFL